MKNYYSLKYNKPASSFNKKDTWQQATLPIGNGIIGANIYGEIGKDMISLNEITLWSGGRSSLSDNKYNGGNSKEERKSIYDEISSQILNGQKFNIERLHGEDIGYDNGYQPLGNITIQLYPKPLFVPNDYVRELDLENGFCKVSFTNKSVKYNRQYFVSNHSNVLVCQYKADGGTFTSLFGFEGKMIHQNYITVENEKIMLKSSGIVENNGLKHCMVMLFSVDKDAKCSETPKGLLIDNATNVTVFISVATDYKNEFYNEDKSISYYYRSGESDEELLNRVYLTAFSALQLGFDIIFDEHKKDFSSLMNRVDIDLGQENTDKTTDILLKKYKKGELSAKEKKYFELLMFQYGRYLFVSSARKNSPLPNNLQGIWNNKIRAPWLSDIHININEQMNYWISGTCNLTECALPLVKYVDKLKLPGRITAEHYTGAKHGIMAHNQNTPFGFTGTGYIIHTWGWCPGAAAWLMQNCYDYFKFSNDADTLKSTIYPFMKEQCLMYEEILVEKNSRKIMPITLSPELSVISAGNTYEQSIIAELYRNTLEAMDILQVDADLKEKFSKTYSLLKPLEIGNSGQIKEWFEETVLNSVLDTRSHRHLSNMLGLYPFALFNTEELKKAGEVSLLNKKFGHIGTKDNPEGGWTYAQLIGSWARINKGENAYFCLSQILKNRIYVNMFDYHEYKPYGAFQIDANFGYSAGFAEMLIQSHLGYIEIFPAVPRLWKDISFKGLLARGNFEINAQRANEKTIEIKVKSLSGGICKLKNDSNLTPQGFVCFEENGILSFETEKGKTYIFR